LWEIDFGVIKIFTIEIKPVADLSTNSF